jgi:hypothetical protein
MSREATDIEILEAEIENVKRNQYMTAQEKELKIKQLNRLIYEHNIK